MQTKISIMNYENPPSQPCLARHTPPPTRRKNQEEYKNGNLPITTQPGAPPNPHPSSYLPSPLRDNQLLLLPQPPCNIHRNLQRRRHNFRRRQRQPLRQRDVHDAVGLVDFDPLQSFVEGGVFDVMACVVREDGGVAGGKVEGAGCGLAKGRVLAR